MNSNLTTQPLTAMAQPFTLDHLILQQNDLIKNVDQQFRVWCKNVCLVVVGLYDRNFCDSEKYVDQILLATYMAKCLKDLNATFLRGYETEKFLWDLAQFKDDVAMCVHKGKDIRKYAGIVRQINIFRDSLGPKEPKESPKLRNQAEFQIFSDEDSLLQK